MVQIARRRADERRISLDGDRRAKLARPARRDRRRHRPLRAVVAEDERLIHARRTRDCVDAVNIHVLPEVRVRRLTTDIRLQCPACAEALIDIHATRIHESACIAHRRTDDDRVARQRHRRAEVVPALQAARLQRRLQRPHARRARRIDVSRAAPIEAARADDRRISINRHARATLAGSRKFRRKLRRQRGERRSAFAENVELVLVHRRVRRADDRHALADELATRAEL